MTTTQPPACGKISEERLISIRKQYRHRAHGESRDENDNVAQELADVADAIDELLSHRHPAPVADERAEVDYGIDHAHTLALLRDDKRAGCEVSLEPCGNCLQCRQYDRAIAFVAALSAQPSGALERAQTNTESERATPAGPRNGLLSPPPERAPGASESPQPVKAEESERAEPVSSADAELSEHARRIDAKGLRDPADGLHKRGNPSRHAEGRERTTLRMETSAIHTLKNLASANAREGITSVLMPADIYSLCLEVIALRRALERIRCRSSELAKKTSVEIRNDLHGIYADAAEALADSFAAPPPSSSPSATADATSSVASATLRAALRRARECAEANGDIFSVREINAALAGNEGK